MTHQREKSTQFHRIVCFESLDVLKLIKFSNKF